ncbi:DUF3365 domain-containing protein [Sulfuricurvum sp.]|uniref:Tll0287-like domain-containing protein n=1 Tax=Sulfuricurvum sp. TaxID=2025608 RepID=UPI001987F8E2|nr:DUF3365 domain-containing protein [Sulfuricurvum sp.]MBD3805544.1 DUF3365 domain-containing protein [Sulfuricurvum sp.]
MTRILLIKLLFVSSVLSAQPLTSEQMIQRGDEVSAKLLQTLGGELKNQIQNGGLIKALHFCSQNALILTDKIAKESGVKIKRISLLNRNPLNHPSAEEKKVIEAWQLASNQGELLPSHTIYNGIYYKPIIINNEVCLKCHGTLQSESPIAKSIKNSYPEDKAVGYKMGDLRGAIQVSF